MLLSGEITEVFVFGGAPPHPPHLPRQTLGLEPIVSQAYRYNRDGTLRSREDLAQAARDLAHGKRWIAAGLELAWAGAFMDQARVIIFYDTLMSRAVRPSEPLGRGTLTPLVRYAWYLLARARIPGPYMPGTYQSLPKPPWSRWGGDDVTILENLACSRYPDKLVHITTRKQIRQLRQVRALAHFD